MTNSGTHISVDRLDEAISWHLRLAAPDAGEAVWSEFTLWLEADPQNRVAYDGVEAIDLELEQPGLAQSIETGATISDFAAFARKPRRSARGWMAGAALIAAGLIVFVAVQHNDPAPVAYATHIGETKNIKLADGTQIDLNTATSIRVQMDAHMRRVTLDHGEAFFHVAKDADHPFVVTVGDRSVRDIGTQFNILRSNGTITVFVAEGRVGVSPTSGDAHLEEIALQPGDQLVHSETSNATTIVHANPAQALAWRQGYLIYSNAPLSRVVSDLNRYFPEPITLTGPQTGAQRFSGVLKVNSESDVLKSISQLLPVTVEYGPGGKISLRASAAKP